MYVSSKIYLMHHAPNNHFKRENLHFDYFIKVNLMSSNFYVFFETIKLIQSFIKRKFIYIFFEVVFKILSIKHVGLKNIKYILRKKILETPLGLVSPLMASFANPRSHHFNRCNDKKYQKPMMFCCCMIALVTQAAVGGLRKYDFYT